MKFKKLMLVAALLFAISIPGLAQDQPETSREDIIQSDVVRLIGNNVHYSIYDIIRVNVDGTAVKLSGYVTEPYKKSSIIKDIKSEIPEVTEVKDEITVLSPSVNDDRLRFILARKIYGDSRLMHYSLDKWPYPIHIIVQNGKVSLEGQVDNKYDATLIESKARETFGVVSVENNLQVS